VFSGELDDFAAGDFTDHYVKLKLPDPNGPDRIRTRTYSVRHWDAGSGELTIDFIVHGDGGVAGPWAAKAEPGDQLELAGPGGAYRPDPAADWHLMVGDASVVPAIAASLAEVPPGAPVYVLIEVDNEQEEQPLTSPGDLHLTWLHRTAAPGEQPELLLDAVRALPDLPGRGHAFIHGEASSVRAVRRHVVTERGLEPSELSASGYWKLRRDDETWRQEKGDWVRQVEADDAAAAR